MGSDHRNSKGQMGWGEERPHKGQSSSWDGHWHGRPRLSQQLPWSLAPLTKVMSNGPKPGLPCQRKLLPNPRAGLLGSGPTPYLGVHRGHSREFHAEHTLVAIHPAHARQRHLREGHTKWAPAGTPHRSGHQPQPLRHRGLSIAPPAGATGHPAPGPRPAQRWGQMEGSGTGVHWAGRKPGMLTGEWRARVTVVGGNEQEIA